MGNIYYVDAANGSDSNDGLSPGSAWQSVQQVNAHGFQPGDTILFHRGDVYDQMLKPCSSGTADQPITFGAYGSGPNPVFSGATELSQAQWVETSPGSHVWTTTVAREGGENPDKIFFDGHQGNIQSAATAPLTEPGDWAWSKNVLSVYSQTDPSAAFHSIQLQTQEKAVYIKDVDHIRLENLDVTRAHLGLVVEGSTGTTVVGVNAYENGYHGIRIIGSDGVVVQGGASHDNGIDGVGTSTNHVGHGVEITGGSTGTVIDGMKLYDNAEDGLQFMTTAGSGNVVRNTEIWGNREDGVDLKQGDQTLDGNHIHDNMENAVNLHAPLTLTLTDNVLQSAERAALSVHNGGVVVSSGNRYEGGSTVIGIGSSPGDAYPAGAGSSFSHDVVIGNSGTGVGIGISAGTGHTIDDVTFVLVNDRTALAVKDPAGTVLVTGGHFYSPGGTFLGGSGQQEVTVDGMESYPLSAVPGSILDLDSQSQVVLGTAGADLMQGGSGSDQLSGLAGDDTLVGDNGHDTLAGGDGQDSLNGGFGNDVLDGGSGIDTMLGGAGDDVYVVDNSGDSVRENSDSGTDTVLSSADYALSANVENLTLTGTASVNATGNASANLLTGNDGANVLDGAAGADTMAGGAGDDTYVVDGSDDVVIEDAGAGIDTIRSTINYVLGANLENLTLIGTAHLATGNALDNVIVGNGSDNVIDGRAGADTMSGGGGDDTYIVDSAGDVIVEGPGGGSDSVQASVNYVLSANVETLTLAGSASIDGTGNEARNLLVGNDGANVLDGGGSADTMAGGAGDDTYVVDNANDVVNEAAGGGTDTVLSSVTYALAANVEKLTLTGAADVNASGNALDNNLVGNGGDNMLDGGAGADTMCGGAGNDTYVVESVGDRVYEAAGAGADTVLSSISYALGANVENLTLTGAATIDATGNAADNLLTGNAAANLLDGGQGADTMRGGDGNDIFVVDDAGDVVIELSGGGTDSVRSSVSYGLDAYVENLTLTGGASIDATGNGLDNALTGNAGDNVLDGMGGADTMAGGDGNDTYVVGSAADVVIEAAGAGTDTVRSSVGYVLGANLENLTLTGTSPLSGTGNALNNVLVANDAGNTLDGGSGADTMMGGGGNDTYVVDDAGDVVVEKAAAGIDLVRSSVSYTLSANVENLTLTGTAPLSGTGNDLDNVITGNSGGDTLDGAAGEDTMIGGAGNDVYVVDRAGDIVKENADSGIDTIQASVTYSASGNVENLTLTGTAAIDATGNVLANVLTGNSGDNVLDGGAGADTMFGGAGDDTYVVDNAGDLVVEGAGAGTDTVVSAVSYELGANVENLTLSGSAGLSATGNAADNILVGNGGSNVLDGGAGADTMSGGAGNDTYMIDSGGDLVVESAGAGTDTVVTAMSYALGANVENLTLTGTAPLSGIGNGLDNVITGNSGGDTLDGGAGADTLIGGLGNDTYIVDQAGDVVRESAGSGTDTVLSSVDFVLGSNLENLTLTGTASIDATGNTLANVLTGNAADNVLNGGAGADTMCGGAGDDTYVVDNAGDRVGEAAGAGTDTVRSAITYTLGANLENLVLTGGTAHNATGNELANVLTGNGAANVLDGGAGADTMAGGAGSDTYVVDNADDVVQEGSGAGIDTVRSSASYTLSANVEHLTLTGSAAINGTGNDLANRLIGNDGANLLSGGNGADTVSGGSGDDRLYGEAGNDVLRGDAGNDVLGGGLGADTLVGGAGNDVFVFAKGEAAGDVISDFAGAGTAGGDSLQFSGFSQNAYLTHAGTVWTIHDGGYAESFTVSGVTTLGADDYHFL